MNALDQYIDLYRLTRPRLEASAPDVMNRQRAAALGRLEAAGALPGARAELHPVLNISEMFAPDYGINIDRVAMTFDPAKTFSCGVPNISTLMGLVVGDTFAPTASLLRGLPQGVEVMSLAAACRQMPQTIAEYYNALAAYGGPEADLNTLLAQDGVLVHVSSGIKMDKPIQITNIFNALQPTMALRRLLVIIDRDASASLLVCDHTDGDEARHLSSQVAEVFLGENAKLEYVDMEESAPDSCRAASFFASLGAGASLTANHTTLQCGRTSNFCRVVFKGPGAEARIAGMAIGSDSQIVDNVTDVRHIAPRCSSNQMYKYILDDASRGSFYGKIVVDEGAVNTAAYQSNRNILASRDALMFTRPQLEIYCDDVKCSHGATVGQLDERALFYMQSRGIPQAQARMMLMQAFVADVVDTVGIEALRSRLHQLVEHRLSGQPDLCQACKVKN